MSANGTDLANVTEVLSGFIPWGGFVNCTEAAECADTLALPGQSPGFLSTCVDFSDGLPENVPLGQYCICNIAYGRGGNNCEDANSPGFAYAILPNVLVNWFTTYFLLKTVIKARGEGLLVPSAATTTTLVTLGVSIFIQVWVDARIWLYLGSPDIIFQINLYCAAVCAGCIVVNMMVVVLVFQAVQASTKKMKKGTGGDGISKGKKQFVAGASSIVMGTVLVLVLAGNTRLASIAAMAFVFMCFVFYIRSANDMKKLLKAASTSNSGGGPNKAAQEAFGRILKLINQIIAFVCVFIPAALMYSRTSTDNKASSLDPNVVSAMGLYLMHLSGSFAVLWIGQFAAGPLLKKVRVSRETTIAQRSSASSSVAPQ